MKRRPFFKVALVVAFSLLMTLTAYATVYKDTSLSDVWSALTTLAAEPAAAEIDSSGSVGKVEYNWSKGYSYQVTVTYTMPEINASFVLVDAKSLDSAHAVSSVTVKAGSKSYSAIRQSGTTWRVFIDNGAWNAGSITAVPVLG